MSDRDPVQENALSTTQPPTRRVRLPGGANEAPAALPGPDEAFIPNAYAGRERLTVREAVDCINFLSAAILADQRHREGG